MAWANGGAGSKIPTAIKRTVRQRQGGTCNTYDPRVCTGCIDEFDHIHNVKRLGIQRAEANDCNNIQGLCKPCHKRKTQHEAHEGRTRGRRKPPRHPSDELS